MPRRRTPRSQLPVEAAPRRGRTGPMAAGLLLAVAALFMAPMSLRETCASMHRDAYVPDQLVLERYVEGHGTTDTVFEGRLVSTGERFQSGRTSIVGLERLRALEREHRVAGTRVDVWSLPAREPWATLDRVNPFRVLAPDEFEQGFPAGLVAANALIAAGSILLIRRGVGPKAAAGGGGPP